MDHTVVMKFYSHHTETKRRGFCYKHGVNCTFKHELFLTYSWFRDLEESPRRRDRWRRFDRGRLPARCWAGGDKPRRTDNILICRTWFAAPRPWNAKRRLGNFGFKYDWWISVDISYLLISINLYHQKTTSSGSKFEQSQLSYSNSSEVKAAAPSSFHLLKNINFHWFSRKCHGRTNEQKPA